MLKKSLAVLKYVLSLGIAGVLLYFAFRNMDFNNFWAKAQKTDYTWVLISIGVSLIAFYARSYRWNILLKPLGYNGLNVHRTNLALLVGYLANLAFPRLGEVTRCAMLNRSDDVPVSSSLGTVITERLVDLFTLIFLILLTMIVEYDRLMNLLTTSLNSLSETPGLSWKLILIGLTVGILGLIIGYLVFKRSQKIREFLRELWAGILSLKDIQNLRGFVIATLIIWVSYYYMSYLIVFAIPETSDLGWFTGVMLLVVGGIALSLPVQGGIGTYHFFISNMLALYSVDKVTGIFLATLLHTSQVVAIGIFGAIALIISVFINRNKKIESDQEKNSLKH